MAPERRRDQLIECAVRVFARNGIGNAGHALVAEEAGVSTPTVFLYMPNRQALIDAVLNEIERYLVELIEIAEARGATASSKFVEITQAFAEATDTHRDHIQVFLNWGSVVHEETWPQYMAFQDRVIARFESIIDNAIARGELSEDVSSISGSHLIMGSANMIAQMKFRGRSEQEIDSFLTALVRGALPKSA